MGLWTDDASVALPQPGVNVPRQNLWVKEFQTGLGVKGSFGGPALVNYSAEPKAK